MTPPGCLIKNGSFKLTIIALLLVPFLFLIFSISEIQQTVITEKGVVDEEAIASTLATMAKLTGRKDPNYHIVNGDGFYKASAPSQNLIAEFRKDSVTLIADNRYRVAMNLKAFGREGEMTPVSETQEINISGNTIHYMKDEITEWYINSPYGLEQGFTLKNRPGNNSTQSPLKLMIALNYDAGLNVNQSDKSGKIMFTHESESVLNYLGLYSYDSKGKQLESTMKITASAIEITVDDQDAIYPVVVDPFIQTKVLSANDGAADDQFGWNSVIDGDTILVSARFADVNGITDSGKVYVFEPDVSGEWQQTETLIPLDINQFGAFGLSTSVKGNRAIITAPGANNQMGKAYIFERDGNGDWSQIAVLESSDGVPGDVFGVSGRIDGDIAVVGAHLAEVGSNEDQGKAYVFERDSSGNWNETAILSASDGKPGEFFGFGTAIDGETIMVGAFFAEVNGNPIQGAAYVYEKVNGVWMEVQKLTTSDGAPFDEFAEFLEFQGDTAIIGSHEATIGNNPIQGAGYVFKKINGQWVEVQKFISSDGDKRDKFALSISLSGDRVILGAHLSEIDGADETGKAYIFRENSITGLWEEERKLTASDGTEFDRFGFNVGISGTTAVVGAPQAEVGSNSQQGKAYVFELEAPHLDRIEPGHAGEVNKIKASGITQGREMRIIYGFSEGPQNADDICPGLVVGIQNFFHLVTVISDGIGLGEFDVLVPVSFDGVSAYVQVIDPVACTASNVNLETFVLPPPKTIELLPIVPSHAGVVNAIDMRDVTPFADVSIIYGFQTGNQPADQICSGLNVGILNFFPLVTVPADDAGNAVFNVFVPLTFQGVSAFVQAVDLSQCIASNVNEETFIIPGLSINIGPFDAGSAGGINTIFGEAATLNGSVVVVYGDTLGSSPVGDECPGLSFGIQDYEVLGEPSADDVGDFFAVTYFTLDVVGQTIYAQAVDLSTCTLSNITATTF